MSKHCSTCPGFEKIPFVVLDGRIENLTLEGVSTNASAERPVLSIGPAASIGLLSLGFTVSARSASSAFLELAKEAHVDRLKVGSNWIGTRADEGQKPILDHGGVIEHLHWVDTPPLYAEAHRATDDPSSLEVMFTQQLKARASVQGAMVTINQNPVSLAGATLQPDGVTMRYKLASSIGELQNLDGTSLHSVSAKIVR